MSDGPKISGKQRLTWPVFDGIAQAAGLTHYTVEEIKLLKKTGSKAFIAKGRIDSLILIQDLNDLLHKASELPEGFTSWKEFGESRRAQISDVELKEKKGLLGLHSDFKRQAGEAVGFIFGELDRRCRENPPAFAGRSAVEIAERMEADTAGIKKNLAAKFDTL